MSVRRWGALVGLALLNGCLASKGDVALLQSDVRSLRDLSVRADSLRMAQIDEVLAQVARANDSVRAVSGRLTKMQGDVASDHYEMGRQILQIQELSGQSQRRLQELRASLEERSQEPASAAVQGDSSRPAPAGPGPAQLFQSSRDQLRRGSFATARGGFEELLRVYPSSEDAPQAMVYIGETYAAERNQVAADSVYGLVVQRYPRAPAAATALYKRALSMKAGGRTVPARAAFERVVRDFPSSDEAMLAREQLKTLAR